MFKKVMIGIVGGFISGFFGAGGGMIVVPACTFILKMDEKKARATTIFAILPMVITSGIIYGRNNAIDWSLAWKASVGGIIGGIIGSYLLKKVSNNFLRIFFVVFLLFMGAKMVWNF